MSELVIEQLSTDFQNENPNWVYQYHFPRLLLDGNLSRVLKFKDTSYDEKYILTNRLIQYYKKVNAKLPIEASGVWSYINKFKRNIHDMLLNEEVEQVIYALDNPSKNMLLHGFDFPTSASIKNINNPQWLEHYRRLCSSSLRSMAEALAVIPLSLPEGYGISSDVQSNTNITISELIEKIQLIYPTEIDFPKL